MKNTFLLFVSIFFYLSCNEVTKPDDEIDYKQEMREFVIGISEYGKINNPDFVIIPQNGIELVTSNGEESGPPNTAYINAIDGNGQEDLFYGYVNDDEATPTIDNSYLRSFLDKSKNLGKTILVTDYCSTLTNMNDSYNQNSAVNYVSFAADHRELDNIPDYPNPIYSENNVSVTSLSGVKNFLYLINVVNYNSKSDFINTITSTNYDLLIMDLFFDDGTEFTATEINQLKNKANGGKRIIISYMSIGEAEKYRYYWQSSWNSNKPSWMDAENPDWAGNFKVKYWEVEWQNIIFENDSSYLKKILNAGFDGVYLDIIDAFEYYEQ
jgi:cysteinyl-tRNA synthetase